MDVPWTCHYRGCRSTPEQIAALRVRRPTGFPHDEDPSLTVCTVCRRLPLKDQAAEVEEEPLDKKFLDGILEELSAIEESEKNIQALSQVFRYYAKHAKQLSKVLCDFATRKCFPWEVIHALHLVDDILLMDPTGRYKAELADRVQGLLVATYKKVKSDKEKRQVARILLTWQDLHIFDAKILEASRHAIRTSGDPSSHLLDEVQDEADVDDDDDDEKGQVSGPSPVPAPPGVPVYFPSPKRQKMEPDVTSAPGLPTAEKNHRIEVVKRPENMGAATAAPAVKEKVVAMVERILAVSRDRPFELLGIQEDGAQGHDIRKAYRKIALLIHPDKNPGLEAKCQEALIKLQQGREQAESDLQMLEANQMRITRSETRSEATAAANAESAMKCRHPDCDLPPCKQCANGCCTRNITHCHAIARSKGGVQCFFHPPPRAWARNA
mmetsp:Transcript_16030/g.37812  ORF Transcript_16030/g.37812 Transcript_16030/m.37812 type:complete len:439 (-) Transcript_16030:86-1402(-)